MERVKQAGEYLHLDNAGNWIAGAGGAALGLAGGWDRMMQVLVVLMAVDYATGVIKGIQDKKLSSQVGFTGLLRKATIFLVVVLAFQLDQALSLESVCRSAAMMFYIANEGLSILENAAAIGLPVPKVVSDRLSQIQSDGQKKTDEQQTEK